MREKESDSNLTLSPLALPLPRRLGKLLRQLMPSVVGKEIYENNRRKYCWCRKLVLGKNIILLLCGSHWGLVYKCTELVSSVAVDPKIGDLSRIATSGDPGINKFGTKHRRGRGR